MVIFGILIIILFILYLIFDYSIVQVYLLCIVYQLTNYILCQSTSSFRNSFTYSTCMLCRENTLLCKNIDLICVCLPWRLYGIFTQIPSVKCIVLDEVWSYHGKQILFYYTNFCHLSKDLHKLLNQVGAGLLPAHPWFLKTVFVQTSVCVCLPQGY